MTLADTSPRFIETIRYADGRLHLLDLHTDRMRATRREVYGRGIPCGAVYIAEGIGIVHNLDRGVLLQEEFSTAFFQNGLLDDHLPAVGMDYHHQLSLFDIGDRDQLRTLAVFGERDDIGISVAGRLHLHQRLIWLFRLTAGGGIAAGGAASGTVAAGGTGVVGVVLFASLV